MNEFKTWIEKHRDWFLDFVRIFVGVILILKGISFISEMDSIMQAIYPEYPEKMKHGYGYAGLAHFIIFSHIIGGVFLTLGFLTRFVIPFQFPTLFIAAVAGPVREIYFKTAPPFESAMLIVLLILLLLWGDGRLSLDYYIYRKKENKT